MTEPSLTPQAGTPRVEEGTEAKVRSIIERIARIEPGFSATADIFRELGVKSAAALDLLLSLEEEFNVAISDDAFGDARTVIQIVALISGLQGAAA
jgi:acyl carrier protein